MHRGLPCSKKKELESAVGLRKLRCNDLLLF
jgi:hypothetical protein